MGVKKNLPQGQNEIRRLKNGIQTYLSDKMLLKYASAENGLKTSKSYLYYLKSYIFGNNKFLGLVFATLTAGAGPGR
jgi:hypothetical protein